MAVPVEKQAGDFVTGGSINKFGTFKFKSLKVGSDTKLAHIIKMVEDAQGSKAPIQKYADKVCKIFVPSVITIALLTFVVWYYFITDQIFFAKSLLNLERLRFVKPANSSML